MTRTDAAARETPTLLVGLDVGSTTVKTVVVDAASLAVLSVDYRRHETCQASRACEMLETVQARFGEPLGGYGLFLTGSGAPALTEALGGRYVHEVNAVSLATERLVPEAHAVVELGGQDAKVIVWTRDAITGVRQRFASMNDRCAGGTGAVLDKIRAKLGVADAGLGAVEYEPSRIHPVAGKCGVFAETDIVGLQRQGVPAGELLASLCDAIVQQNLRVLTRGHVLRPVVLLLGGPNRFLPVLQSAWRANLRAHWAEREVEVPADRDVRDLVVVPERALHFAAFGAVLYGREEGLGLPFQGTATLRTALARGETARGEGTGRPLVADREEARAFAGRYAIPLGGLPAAKPHDTVEAFLGIDAGSTSTKGVLLDRRGRLVAKAYRLSAGSPILDTQAILEDLRRAVEGSRASLRVIGVGVTGYAKELIHHVIGADVAVVETVAHARSAVQLWPEVDVVCDVGGQDIKVLFLRQGRIWDFRLNSQCSAGNGYFLQATAGRFGIPVDRFAETAFSARRAPSFHFGCAVFLESDIVNAQQLGWTPSEILAGLAQVLPRNVWLYVVQEPNLAKFGRRFLLQGGVQRNAAALKAQVDYIEALVPGAEVCVHDHPGEGGAIGAALEAARGLAEGRTRFIGFEAAAAVRVEIRRDESTRCRNCRNRCLRTFIRALAPDGGERRQIIATCERGVEEDPARVHAVHRRMRQVAERAPNLVAFLAERAFRRPGPTTMAPGPGGAGPVGWHRAVRRVPRVGIPRVLDFYSVAPFFTAYLEAAGVPFENLVFSDPTGEALFREGSRRGAIDPCFPAKAALAHVHQLVTERAVDIVFFPRLMTLPRFLHGTLDSMTCPAVAAAPDVVRAALAREPNAFAGHGVEFLSPTLHMAEPELLSEQLYQAWHPHLELSRRAHAPAVRQGWDALDRFVADLRREGDRVLSRLEAEGGLAVVVLGRPYHADPGINHLIVDQIHRLGYAMLPVEALPVDAPRLARLAGDGRGHGTAAALRISDVWPHAYNENSDRKLWGARYAASHPNLVAVDLSNFKCGHDAPMYDLIPRILEETGTPYFTFHDLDENRPGSSITLRIETLHYFLSRHEEARAHEARGRCRSAEVCHA